MNCLKFAASALLLVASTTAISIKGGPPSGGDSGSDGPRPRLPPFDDTYCNESTVSDDVARLRVMGLAAVLVVCDRVTLTASDTDWTVDFSECAGGDVVHGRNEDGQLIIAGAKASSESESVCNFKVTDGNGLDVDI